jgi:hypothetical protein
MPVIAEEPEMAFNLNNKTIESPSITLDADANNALASAPAALNQQQYVCPAHPDIDR